MDWKFWKNREPEIVDKEEEVDIDKYKATLEYNNGDIETLEYYDIFYGSIRTHSINFLKDYDIVENNSGYKIEYSNIKQYSYHTLVREPIIEHINTKVFNVKWKIDKNTNNIVAYKMVNDSLEVEEIKSE